MLVTIGKDYNTQAENVKAAVRVLTEFLANLYPDCKVQERCFMVSDNLQTCCKLWDNGDLTFVLGEQLRKAVVCEFMIPQHWRSDTLFTRTSSLFNLPGQLWKSPKGLYIFCGNVNASNPFLMSNQKEVKISLITYRLNNTIDESKRCPSEPFDPPEVKRRKVDTVNSIVDVKIKGWSAVLKGRNEKAETCYVYDNSFEIFSWKITEEVSQKTERKKIFSPHNTAEHDVDRFKANHFTLRAKESLLKHFSMEQLYLLQTGKSIGPAETKIKVAYVHVEENGIDYTVRCGKKEEKNARNLLENYRPDVIFGYDVASFHKDIFKDVALDCIFIDIVDELKRGNLLGSCLSIDLDDICKELTGKELKGVEAIEAIEKESGIVDTYWHLACLVKIIPFSQITSVSRIHLVDCLLASRYPDVLFCPVEGKKEEEEYAGGQTFVDSEPTTYPCLELDISSCYPSLINYTDEPYLSPICRHLISQRKNLKTQLQTTARKIHGKALKLAANLIYGYLGYRHRVFAAQVTEAGRNLISELANLSVEFCINSPDKKEGTGKIMYIDTDGWVISVPTLEKKFTKQLLEHMNDSDAVKELGSEIKIDGSWKRFFHIMGKSYAYQDEHDEYGFSSHIVNNRSTPVFFRKKLKILCVKLLQNKHVEFLDAFDEILEEIISTETNFDDWRIAMVLRENAYGIKTISQNEIVASTQELYDGTFKCAPGQIYYVLKGYKLAEAFENGHKMTAPVDVTVKRFKSGGYELAKEYYLQRYIVNPLTTLASKLKAEVNISVHVERFLKKNSLLTLGIFSKVVLKRKIALWQYCLRCKRLQKGNKKCFACEI